MTDLTCYTTAHLDCFVMALERDERERERGGGEGEREAGRTNCGEQRKAMCLRAWVTDSHAAQQSERST